MTVFRTQIKIVVVYSFLFFAFQAIFFPSKVEAYIDPGTGSYVLQIMAAAFFGALFLLRTWWREIKHFFFQVLLRKDSSRSEKLSPKEK